MNSLTYIQNEFLPFLNPHDHVHHDPHDHAHRGRHDQINCPKILFLHDRAHHDPLDTDITWHHRRPDFVPFVARRVLLRHYGHDSLFLLHDLEHRDSEFFR